MGRGGGTSLYKHIDLQIYKVTEAHAIFDGKV